MKFANFAALKRVTGQKLITKNVMLLTIRILILVCIIGAASGTVFWYEGKVNKNDFVLAIDVSASMGAQDVEPTRIDAAKQAALDFINNLKSKSNIGIVTFSGTTFIDTVPIDNKEHLRQMITDITAAKTGGTDIPGAIITSTNLLLGSEKGKAIILITDGSNTVGAFIEDSVQNSIDYALENHIVVHTIGVGSEAGPIGYLPEYYNISAVYSEQTLIRISNSTGGKYYTAMNKEELTQAYGDISEAADTGFIPVKLSPVLTLAALLLLFLEWGLINTRFRKVP